MNTIIIIAVVALQVLVGHFLGFGGAYALEIGNGWELLAIPIGNTFGVWIVGISAAIIRGTFNPWSLRRRFIGTIIGSAIGVLAILVTSPSGFLQLLYPLLGAILGFDLASRMRLDYAKGRVFSISHDRQYGMYNRRR